MAKKKGQSLSEDFIELEKITDEFEKSDVDLEEGIPKFKRGLELARKLKKRLSEIENEIEEIKTEFKDLEEKPMGDKEIDVDEELDEEAPF